MHTDTMLRLLITDFDGTLADTFEAHYLAYSDAFDLTGRNLSPELYREGFGMRSDDFMQLAGITDPDEIHIIAEANTPSYGRHLDKVTANTALLEFIRWARQQGILTAVASTSHPQRLQMGLEAIGALNDFDYILSGHDITHPKPHPEVYLRLLELADVPSDDALVFEDSPIGIQAAQSAHIPVMQVNLGHH